MIKNNPLITVITPTLNSEKYIKECIESTYRQSFDNFEHIIVDGGSHDSTIEIIHNHINF